MFGQIWIGEKRSSERNNSLWNNFNKKDFNLLDINLENGLFYGQFRFFSELKQKTVSAMKNMKTEIFISDANKEKP